MKTRDLARGSSMAVRNSWLDRRRLNHDNRVLSFFLREGEGGAPSTACSAKEEEEEEEEEITPQSLEGEAGAPIGPLASIPSS